MVFSRLISSQPLAFYGGGIPIVPGIFWRGSTTAPKIEARQEAGSQADLDIGQPHQVLTKLQSSTPVATPTELEAEYQDVGHALDQLEEVGEDDEWGLEPGVYNAARKVGAELLANMYPAPHVFSHGARSVVFNWTFGGDNIYLTISADRISALISSATQIRKRLVYSPNAFLGRVRIPLLAFTYPSEAPTLAAKKVGSDPYEMAS